jgi:Bacterial regulatory proteins, tetR family
MAREHSSAGDPTSSLVLLWRTPGERESPSGLGADRIVGAAIDLADARGLSAVSMRRVADRLGVGTMSLYTHVPGKAELLDAMLDVVLAETARPQAVPAAGVGGWRSSRGRTWSSCAGTRGSSRSTSAGRRWART